MPTQPSCVSKAKNHSKIHRWQVRAVLSEQKYVQTRKGPQVILAVLPRGLTQYGRISARQNRVCPCQPMVSYADDAKRSVANATDRFDNFSQVTPHNGTRAICEQILRTDEARFRSNTCRIARNRSKVRTQNFRKAPQFSLCGVALNPAMCSAAAAPPWASAPDGP